MNTEINHLPTGAGVCATTDIKETMRDRRQAACWRLAVADLLGQPTTSPNGSPLATTPKLPKWAVAAGSAEMGWFPLSNVTAQRLFTAAPRVKWVAATQIIQNVRSEREIPPS